jgi:small ligand-binding sensory domain FIST
VGGLTSSRGAYLQIADEIVPDGLSGVMFASDVSVATRLTQGCALISARHQITAAQNNILIEIDNRPALEVFYEDIGEVLARDLNKIAGYIFAALPVPGSDTGDYLVRNLLGIDPEHELIAISENVQTGNSIMFARRDPQTAYEDLVRVLKTLKKDVKEPLKGGVYFSCLGRGKNMFGQDSQELKAIQSVLGDFPLVGFFASGEISHQRLYGYTGVLTLFL